VKRQVFIWGSDRIGVIDFCEVTNEGVLERNTCWKWNRLVFNWGFKSIDGIDFCEVTNEGVLEMETIGL
jgi:hypothetical protein